MATGQVIETVQVGDSPRWVLADPEGFILREIGDREFKRRDVAQSYRLAMEAEAAGVAVDWAKVNRAIIDRWSASALAWIKEQAWSGRCFATQAETKGEAR